MPQSVKVQIGQDLFIIFGSVWMKRVLKKSFKNLRKFLEFLLCTLKAIENK